MDVHDLTQLGTRQLLTTRFTS